MTAFNKAWKVVKGGGLHADDPTARASWHRSGGDESNFVDDVRDLVEQGMEVMPAVRNIAEITGVDGRKLMRAYVEAYR